MINISETTELSSKRLLGNSMADVLVKHKRRKVPVRREFPKGCGRFLQSTGPEETAIANGGVEIGMNSVTAEGSSCTKLPLIFTPEPLDILMNAESSNSVEALKHKSAKSPEDLDRVISTNTVKDDEPLVNAFVPQTLKPFETSHQVESLETLKSRAQIPALLPKVELPGMPSGVNQPQTLNMSMDNESPQGNSKEIVRDTKAHELAVEDEENLTWEDVPSEEKFKEEKSEELDTSLATCGVQLSRDTCIHEKVKETDLSEDMISHIKSQDLAVVNEGFAVRKDMPAEEIGRDKKSEESDLGLIAFSVQPSNDIFIREKVKGTLHMFQEICKELLHDQRENREDRKFKPVSTIAADRLKKEKKWINSGKPIFGSIAGVEVGDEFNFRVELAIVGLHRTFQSGIDYTNVDGKLLAISVVATGRYDADELDKSDVLVYSGEGGKPMSGHKQAKDQKLERGNLSLKNSMDAGSVVRVIRGFKQAKGRHHLNASTKSSTKYIYDGLYLVEKYWQDMGLYGASIFKFQLRRIPGQPEVGWTELNKLKRSTQYEDTCVSDISQGKEKILIRAVNNVDDEKPPPFIYTTKMIYSKWFNPASHRGCDCTDGCLDPKRCLCAMKNGGEVPFNNDGDLLEIKPLIYECGPSCKCCTSCSNRVSQRGIKFPLEIFKTISRGWGVRSRTSIPCGSFICEYVGELLQEKDAEERNKDDYLFDIGRNYDGLDLTSSCEIMGDVGYTIDAASYGNIGRFINHSCSPNLYAQSVLYDHDDDRIPHIMLFATEDIPALQELTYDYNYQIDQVCDAKGNIKRKSCYCGSSSCIGRLY